jgi:hypothetical protein
MATVKRHTTELLLAVMVATAVGVDIGMLIAWWSFR